MQKWFSLQKKDNINDSVKGFPQHYNNITGKTTIAKSIYSQFCEAYLSINKANW